MKKMFAIHTCKFKPSCTCFSCLFVPLVVFYIKSWPIDCTSHDNHSVLFPLLDKILINNFSNFNGIRTSYVYNSSIDVGHFVHVFGWSSISFCISLAALSILLLLSPSKFYLNSFSVGTSSLKAISPFPSGAQKHSLLPKWVISLLFRFLVNNPSNVPFQLV